VDAGLILGRYRPLMDLGEGGHGIVTLAYDTRMARRVAIKRIPLTEEGIARLSRSTGLAEARTSALLNHPNIVTVHDWDTDEHEAFLVMEHVDGASLADVLDAYAPLQPDEAAAIVGPIARALAFAHDNGVLHLDVKPENVLVMRDGTVKVADFGVASLTGAAGFASSAGGTLGYMPPEQLRGERVTAATDQWAMAALVYETLTGRLPFGTGTSAEAMHSAEATQPLAPTSLAPELPDAVDDVLFEALEPSPRDRFPGVLEFANSLLPLLGDSVRGRASLVELVAAISIEEEPEPPRAEFEGGGLWDRLSPRSSALARVAGALGCGWLAWSGIDALHLGWPSGLATAALAAAAAAAAPPLGLALAIIVGAVGLIPASPLVGVAFAATGVAWWVGVGRRHAWAGVTPLFSPLFGALRVGPALPVIAGLLMPSWWQAAAAGGLSGLVLVAVSAASSAAAPFLTVDPAALARPLAPLSASPAPLSVWWLPAVLTSLGWALAALLANLGARRATRPFAVVGSLAGLAVALASVSVGTTGFLRIGRPTVVSFVASSILVIVVIVMGPPPLRGGDDEERG
jgi:eukaryotic-like serine/threonine-protein kinase